ncbi:hypothetical protein [Arthrobacter sp. PM3]|uniref:hypothetical protein n=1 Tax=Arthrobacter sp. PM3 TaxID=2017685 RepID=UPI000E10C398|nr:hypothetical protein [Arthrobacter sp. PM3]AXJ08598.1 hypothetical protein CFN17_02375 [Arthrobacter sp. PM3]
MTSQEPRSAGDAGTPDPRGRGDASPDLSSTHVTHVRDDVAMAGRCANVHLPTGRTCTLPVRHPGSCNFVGPEDAGRVAAH